MKKMIAVCLALMMALSMAACKKKKSKKKDIDDIKSIDGTMLKVSSASYELQDPNYDQWTGAVFYVRYDGTLECTEFWSISDNKEYSTVLSDSDLMDVYEFCQEYGDGEKLKGYEEQAADGEKLKFTYIDEDGEEHFIYFGYCYQNEALWNLYTRLGSYIRNL